MKSHTRQPRVMLLGIRILQHEGSLYVENFGHNIRVIWRKPSEFTERLESLLISFLGEKPSWRIWIKNHPEAEDESWKDLESQWKSPGSIRLTRASVRADVVVWVECWDVCCSCCIRNVRCASGTSDVVGSIVDPETGEDADGDRHWSLSVLS